ncbi:MBL fold metallo-hydrolase [Arenibacter palladensis]|uniref:MBL fold metallo-hydrolase n=1 Tax=Arenibacter palladensis TaxID=237373 RepID=UPI002FD5A73C
MEIISKTDITWFPNSWIRLRINKKVIYFDPAYLKTYFSKYPDKTEYSKWPDPIDGMPNGLEKADLIFITHHHKDHCKRVTVDRLLKLDTIIFAPKSCLKELGDRINLVKPNETLQIDNGISLKVLNAYNTQQGTSTIKQHKKGIGVGFILTIDGLSFYHLGDTDFLVEMEEVKDIHVAFVPIGGKFTMNIDEAVKTTLSINPKIVIPIHNLGQDFWEFQNKLNDKGKNIRCIIPTIGQPIKVQKQRD